MKEHMLARGLQELKNKGDMTMPAFNLYCADCIGNERNFNYTHEIVVGDERSLRAAVGHDHVAIAYQGSKSILTPHRPYQRRFYYA